MGTRTGKKSRIPAIVITSKSSESKQRQVYHAIVKWIREGTFPKGTRLPSSREIATDLGVSRNTIMAVYDQLLAEGYVIAEEGRGTFVQAEFAFQANQFSPRRRRAKKSLVSKLANRAVAIPTWADSTEVKPFTLGIPAIDQFPFPLWRRAYSKALRRNRSQHFGFGDCRGLPGLRQAICRYVSIRRGVRCDPAQILIVASAQQAFDLIGRMLVNDGDAVVHEEPGYFLARGAFQLSGARIVPAQVDISGAKPGSVQTRSAGKIKFAYLTPSHQSPLGMSMPFDRRVEWLRFAQDYDCMLVEDDFDSEYRYDVEPVPALQSLDANGRVIYVGSFSKSLFPGIRLGFVVLPEELIPACLAIRGLNDGFVSSVVQNALADFIDSGCYARHIRSMRNLYRERFQSALCSLQKHLGFAFVFSTHELGLHITGVFRDQQIDDVRLAAAVAEEGVELKPLSLYYFGRKKQTGIVFGFAAWDEQCFEEAAVRLARVLQRHFRFRPVEELG